MLRFIAATHPVAGLTIIWVLLLAGCEERSSQTATTVSNTAEPRASVALRVLVVNEPELAQAIGRLRGEWAERSGGSLTAEGKTWADVAAGHRLEADLIVFPSRYLGELCVRDWLRPVRANVLQSDELDVADIFPVVRRELMTWGGQVMALPLGVDLPTSREPVGRRPAIAFLVWAAPDVVSNDRLGVLFDPGSMKPRISEPPFVQALRQLATASDRSGPTPSAEAPRVPVLGVGDRLAAVAATSRNAASAFKLLEWLAGAEVSSQIARAGSGTMPVRRSLASSAAWYHPKLSSSERAELAKLLQTALSQQRCLFIPRIPGVDAYLAALDAAVQAAVREKVEPQLALHKAAEEWEKITAARGRETQRAAYLRHLGISEP